VPKMPRRSNSLRPAGDAPRSRRSVGAEGIWETAFRYGHPDKVLSEIRHEMELRTEYLNQVDRRRYHESRLLIFAQLGSVLLALAAMVALAIVTIDQGGVTAAAVAFGAGGALTAAVSVVSWMSVRSGRILRLAERPNQTFTAEVMNFVEPEEPLALSSAAPLLSSAGQDLQERPTEILVNAYLDTDDEAASVRVFNAIDSFVGELGYGKPNVVALERGSFFRKAFAAIRRGLNSRQLRDRLAEGERALQLAIVEDRQAEVDLKKAQAASELINSLQDVPNACIQMGSLLLVKSETPNGQAILARTLSKSEMRALEKYPELQKNPEKIMEALSMAKADENPELEGPRDGQAGST
jgi:hypothetical protein